MANLLKIKDLIRERKITLRELATTIGITEQGLQKLIRENSTKVDTLETIAKALSVPVSYFFDDNSSMSCLETAAIKAGKPALITESERVGRAAPVTDSSNESRLWAMIESQQRMLESQQRTIEELTKKRIAEDVQGAAPRAAQG